jgi:hypothetical protein
LFSRSPYFCISLSLLFNLLLLWVWEVIDDAKHAALSEAPRPIKSDHRLAVKAIDFKEFLCNVCAHIYRTRKETTTIRCET